MSGKRNSPHDNYEQIKEGFNTNYKEAIAYLNSFINFERLPEPRMDTREADLERFKLLLNSLDNPQSGMKIIHIAGTKGKGSTAAMFASVLTSAGYRTGLYTSPHLISVRERICLDGQMISKGQFAQAMTAIQAVQQDAMVEQNLAFRTVFEHLTAAAMLFFKEKDVEVAVVETGLGGRLDTTVVFDPVLAIMTPIGLDHQAVLGDTIEKIAADKAHIFKKDVPALTAPQSKEALRELEKRSSSFGMPLNVAPGWSEFTMLGRSLSGTNVVASREWMGEVEIRLPLAGKFQLTNLSTVLSAIEILRETGINISTESMVEGIADVKWEGRLQVLEGSPTVILDGSHNDLAMSNLMAALKELNCTGNNLSVVFSALKGKPVSEMLRSMVGKVGKVYLTEINFPKGSKIEELEEAIEDMDLDYLALPSPGEALKTAMKDNPSGYVLVTGSFYLVGEVLRHWQGLPAPPADGRIDDAV